MALKTMLAMAVLTAALAGGAVFAQERKSVV